MVNSSFGKGPASMLCQLPVSCLLTPGCVSDRFPVCSPLTQPPRGCLQDRSYPLWVGVQGHLEGGDGHQQMAALPGRCGHLQFL